MSFQINNPKANLKNVLHGFFLALAVTVAEPSTILPLIVHHFSNSVIAVGIFASLLKGGAIAVQLWAAFHAQEYARVMPHMRIVFFFRWFSWFLIGLSIYFIGDKNKTLTLWLIGIGLFMFSFTAGFGAIYFKELIAKVFSKDYRGKTMANRQIWSAIGSILSGGVAGYVLANYPAPLNYAYLFMVSSFLMAIGFVAFGSIDEPIKQNTRQKEKSFMQFLQNAFAFLKTDRRLRIQIIVILLGFSYLLAYPFVILKANQSFKLTGWMVGGFITIQMIGSIIGSFFMWRRIHNYKLMLRLSFTFALLAFVVALFANTPYMYAVVFLLFGFATDGFSISSMNLIFEIAPEDKRPIYTALQSNITSVGLFFPIVGGSIIKYANYTVLYILTIFLIAVGLVMTKKLDQ
ncbi:MAG: MFS transporter [Epsilonproteobacteria bacterium]|nr:MFS transporter [Campylobacterota bacterium]